MKKKDKENQKFIIFGTLSGLLSIYFFTSNINFIVSNYGPIDFVKTVFFTIVVLIFTLVGGSVGADAFRD